MLFYLSIDVFWPRITIYTSINRRNSVLPLSYITIVKFIHFKHFVRFFRWCEFIVSISIIFFVWIKQATSMFGIGHVIFSYFGAIHLAYTHWFFSGLFMYYLVWIVLESFNQVGSILWCNLTLHCDSWCNIFLIEHWITLITVLFSIVIYGILFYLTFVINRAKIFKGLFSSHILTWHHIRLGNSFINLVLSSLEIHFTSVLWYIFKNPQKVEIAIFLWALLDFHFGVYDF